MKVLFIHSLADLYGSSRSLLQLIDGLRIDDVDVEICLSETGPLADAFISEGLTVEILQYLPVMHRKRLKTPKGCIQFIVGIIRSTYRLIHIIKTSKIDIVHTNTGGIFPVGGIAAFFCRIPHVTHIRESFVEYGRLWIIYRYMLKMLSDKIICISDSLLELFHKNEKKVIRIYNGISTNEIYQLPESETKLYRKKWCSSPNTVFIGVIGRINLQRKGQGIFVEVLSRIVSRHPEVRGVIIGKPFVDNTDHWTDLLNKIRTKGLEDQVYAVGEMANINPALNALDILVIPSMVPEGFGRVTVEAMALGKPVIGTRLGGTAEIIEDGGTGILIPPGDADALEAALEVLISQPELRDVMGKSGFARFNEFFRIETSVEAVLELYKRLI